MQRPNSRGQRGTPADPIVVCRRAPAPQQLPHQNEKQQRIHSVQDEIRRTIAHSRKSGEIVHAGKSQPAQLHISPHVTRVGEHPFQPRPRRITEKGIEGEIDVIIPTQQLEAGNSAAIPPGERRHEHPTPHSETARFGRRHGWIHPKAVAMQRLPRPGQRSLVHRVVHRIDADGRVVRDVERDLVPVFEHPQLLEFFDLLLIGDWIFRGIGSGRGFFIGLMPELRGQTSVRWLFPLNE